MGLMKSLQTDRLRHPMLYETTATRSEILDLFTVITDPNKRKKGWLSGDEGCWVGKREGDEDFRVICGQRSKKDGQWGASIWQYWAASVHIADSDDGQRRMLLIEVVFWRTKGGGVYGKQDLENLRRVVQLFLSRVAEHPIDHSHEVPKTRGKSAWPWSK